MFVVLGPFCKGTFHDLQKVRPDLEISENPCGVCVGLTLKPVLFTRRISLCSLGLQRFPGRSFG